MFANMANNATDNHGLKFKGVPAQRGQLGLNWGEFHL
jgi:hypothetical protein